MNSRGSWVGMGPLLFLKYSERLFLCDINNWLFLFGSFPCVLLFSLCFHFPFLSFSFPIFLFSFSFLPVFPFSLFSFPSSCLPFSPCFPFSRVFIPFSCSTFPLALYPILFLLAMFPFCVSALSFLFPCFVRYLVFLFPYLLRSFYDAFMIGSSRVFPASVPLLSDWAWIADVEFQYFPIL